MVADQSLVFDSGISIFKVNDGSQLRDLSPYVKELKLSNSFKTNDAGAWGAVGDRPVASVKAKRITADFNFNMVTDVGVETVLGAMHDAKALRAWEFYPAGTAVGNTKYSGNALLPIYEITSRYKTEMTVHAEFEIDNGGTRGTA
jgi:hypothetical protein